MKPRYLAWLAGLVSLAYAFGLVRLSRDDLDIWIGLAGWLIGFWFAASILSLGRRDGQEEEDPEEDWEEDEG